MLIRRKQRDMNKFLPITSREYKLILNSSRFKKREEGCKQFWDLVEFWVNSNQGKIDSGTTPETWKIEIRKTWYLDTPDLKFKENNFSLRVRQEDRNKDNQYKISLKYRSEDHAKSASKDVSSPQNSKPKFEEDIVPPFISKFSRSNSIDTSDLPKTISDVLALFPRLSELKVADSTAIQKVNNFVAHEICLKTPKRIRFNNSPTTIKACFSFWYLLGKDDEYPLISEFSFDYDIPDNPSNDFLAFKESSNLLFANLQKFTDWLSSGNSTKTAFVFDI